MLVRLSLEIFLVYLLAFFFFSFFFTDDSNISIANGISYHTSKKMRKTTVADLFIETDRLIWQMLDALPLWKGLQK